MFTGNLLLLTLMIIAVGIITISPTKYTKHILIASLILMLGASWYYQQPSRQRAASLAEQNEIILQKIEIDDLLLCTDMKNQVIRALLVRSVVLDKRIIHGIFLDQETITRTNGGMPFSYFDRCRLDAFRDDGLGSVDKRIGRILRLGLNPPPPK